MEGEEMQLAVQLNKAENKFIVIISKKAYKKYDIILYDSRHLCKQIIMQAIRVDIQHVQSQSLKRHTKMYSNTIKRNIHECMILISKEVYRNNL